MIQVCTNLFDQTNEILTIIMESMNGNKNSNFLLTSKIFHFNQFIYLMYSNLF